MQEQSGEWLPLRLTYRGVSNMHPQVRGTAKFRLFQHDTDEYNPRILA